MHFALVLMGTAQVLAGYRACDHGVPRLWSQGTENLRKSIDQLLESNANYHTTGSCGLPPFLKRPSGLICAQISTSGARGVGRVGVWQGLSPRNDLSVSMLLFYSVSTLFSYNAVFLTALKFPQRPHFFTENLRFFRKHICAAGGVGCGDIDRCLITCWYSERLDFISQNVYIN